MSSAIVPTVSSASSSTSSSSSSASSSSSSSFVFEPPSRYVALSGPTVWHVFSPLAVQCAAINLGQGFPGWCPPSFVQNHLHQVTDGDFLNHQYARSQGNLELVSELASIYSSSLSQKIDPTTQVIVTNGASGALYCAILGILNPDDECIVFEPAFDMYSADIVLSGAKIVPVPVRLSATNKWFIDMNELRSKFSSKTKLVLLNSPHNPTGLVLNVDDLNAIASMVLQHPRCVVISDEVYEHMIYDNASHVSIASLPNMFERTLTISSAGKSLSTTGWKIGWAVGPSTLVNAVNSVQQWAVFSVATPLQIAVAKSLREARTKEYEGETNFFVWLRKDYERKRNYMLNELTKVGLKPVSPAGGFFIVCDTSNIVVPDDYLNETTKNDSGATVKVVRDFAFCKFLTKQIGVAAIPPSAFLCDENKQLAANLARIAFCKPDQVLEQAVHRLQKLKDHLRQSQP